MYRAFINKDLKKDDQVFIDEYNHIVNVLRMTPGQEIELAGNNGVFLSTIEDISNQLRLKVGQEIKVDTESPIKISLYQALAKGDKFEDVVRKSVELGVYEVIPVETQRCVVKLTGSKKDRKIGRYQSISESAAKQSKRAYIPRVRDLTNIRDISTENLLVAYEEEGVSFKDVLKKYSGREISILVGPEGGFSREEIDYLIGKGARVVNFGDRILRTETAGLFLISAIQYELGDMG